MIEQTNQHNDNTRMTKPVKTKDEQNIHFGKARN